MTLSNWKNKWKQLGKSNNGRETLGISASKPGNVSSDEVFIDVATVFGLSFALDCLTLSFVAIVATLIRSISYPHTLRSLKLCCSAAITLTMMYLASDRKAEGSKPNEQQLCACYNISRYLERFSSFDQDRLDNKCIQAHQQLDKLLQRINELVSATPRITPEDVADVALGSSANQDGNFASDSSELAAMFTIIDLVNVVNILIAINTVMQGRTEHRNCPVSRAVAIDACILGVENLVGCISI